jgi:hypothetical protein
MYLGESIDRLLSTGIVLKCNKIEQGVMPFSVFYPLFFLCKFAQLMLLNYYGLPTNSHIQKITAENCSFSSQKYCLYEKEFLSLARNLKFDFLHERKLAKFLHFVS